MKSNKLTCPLPLVIEELSRDPIKIAEVIVAGVDFFRIPKYKGTKLTPAIINEFIRVVGTVVMISEILTGTSKKPIIGLKIKTSILMI